MQSLYKKVMFDSFSQWMTRLAWGLWTDAQNSKYVPTDEQERAKEDRGWSKMSGEDDVKAVDKRTKSHPQYQDKWKQQKAVGGYH